MFFHIYKNTFIINNPVPDIIRMNYNIKNFDIDTINDIYELLNILYKMELSFKKPTFVIVDNILINPIIREFFLCMRLPYEAYKIMTDYSDFYTEFCINRYQPMYKDKYIKIKKENFSEDYNQYIYCNIGNLPFEFLINHIDSNRYSKKIYKLLFYYYKNEIKSINDIQNTDINILDFNNFINDKWNNLCYTNEFTFPLYNKKLMLYLKKIKYRIDFLENQNVDQYI